MGRADGEAYRESMVSPSPFQIVDFVDHQAELFELPPKVRLLKLSSSYMVHAYGTFQSAKVAPVTYSKATQTMTSISTSTDGIGYDDAQSEGEDGMGRRRRRKGEADESGKETEDEMRKRILEEMDEERKALEKELRELREKTEELTIAGE